MQDLAVSIFSFLTALLGIFLNNVVLLMIPRLPRDHLARAVKQITLSKCVCNMVMGSVLLYIGTMTLFEIPFFHTHSNIIGTLTLILYEYGNLSGLFLAVDRFWASHFHLSYPDVFTSRSITSVFGLITLSSVLYPISLYKVFECQPTYDSHTATFQFGFSGTCSLPVRITDVGLNVAIMTVSLALNCMCVLRKRFHTGPMPTPPLQSQAANRMIRIAVILNLTVLAGQLSCYLLAPLSSSIPTLHFVFSNFWGFTSALEPFVILVSSEGMRKEIKKLFRSNKSRAVIRPALTVVPARNIVEIPMGPMFHQI